SQAYVALHTLFFFFFSSRRRHTRFSRDWSRRVLFRSAPAPSVYSTGPSERTRALFGPRSGDFPPHSRCRRGPDPVDYGGWSMVSGGRAGPQCAAAGGPRSPLGHQPRAQRAGGQERSTRMKVRSSALVAAVGAAGIMAPVAMAQYADSPWPSWRGGPGNQASVQAPGPATNLDFALREFGLVAVGGFTVDDDGDIYFKTRSDAGARVYRMNPASGAVLASTPVLPSNGGAYAGVAVGRDAVYTCLYNGAGATSVLKLNKNTLAIIDEFTD